MHHVSLQTTSQVGLIVSHHKVQNNVSKLRDSYLNPPKLFFTTVNHRRTTARFHLLGDRSSLRFCRICADVQSSPLYAILGPLANLRDPGLKFRLLSQLGASQTLLIHLEDRIQPKIGWGQRAFMAITSAIALIRHPTHPVSRFLCHLERERLFPEDFQVCSTYSKIAANPMLRG